MPTGFYAVPCRKGEGTKVHFADNDDRPICRAPLRKGSEFFECARGWVFRIVECQRCRNIANRLQRSPYD